MPPAPTAERISYGPRRVPGDSVMCGSIFETLIVANRFPTCSSPQGISTRWRIAHGQFTGGLDASAARQRWHQIVRQFRRRTIPITRVLRQAPLHHGIERLNLSRLSRQVILASQQRREDLVRRLASKRKRADQ